MDYSAVNMDGDDTEANNDNAAVNNDANSLQLSLKTALDNRDLEEFSRCISSDINTIWKMYDDEMTINDKVLSTHGCSEFVKLCQKAYDSDTCCWRLRHSLNYAVMSMDPLIVQILLSSDRMNEKLNGLTPLNYLAKHVTDHNAENVLNCMRLLLKHDAAPHIPDEQNVPALGHVLHSIDLNDTNRRKLIEEICRYEPIDNDDLASEIVAKFPDYLSSTTYVSVRCRDIERFKRYFIQNQPTEAETAKHLFNAIETKQNDFFDFLLENGADCTAAFDSRGRTALDHSLEFFNLYTLKILSEKQGTQFSNMHSVHERFIIIFIKLAGGGRYSEEAFECLDILRRSEGFDINHIDYVGNTLLHYSHIFDERSVLGLLDRGAFVGTKANDGEIAVDTINPKYLEGFFDNLISPAHYARLPAISINYRPLMPPTNNTDKYLRQMEVIGVIADCEDKKYLLEHQSIAIFLFFKWKQLSRMFYINFWLYVFFAVSTVWYMLLKLSARESGTTTLWVMSWLAIVYLLTREGLQLRMAWRKYVRSIRNWLELLMLLLVILICSSVGFTRPTEKVMAVVTILLITIELFKLLGSLPILSMSTCMHMFQVVCVSFLKNFMLFSVFVVAFSLCFYIMFGLEADANGGFNKFTNPLTAFLKTTIMMTGELEAGSLQFETSFSYILLFLCLFVLTIVLYNLLNGTAIRDILEIEGQAKLNEAIYRAKLIGRYDRILYDHFPKLIRIYFTSSITEVYINPTINTACGTFALDAPPEMEIDTKRTLRSNHFDKVLFERALHIAKERKDNSKPSHHEPRQQIENLENIPHESVQRIEKRLEKIENMLCKFESRLSDIAEALNKTEQ